MNTVALHEIVEKEKMKEKIARKHLKFLIYILQIWKNLLNQRYYIGRLNLTNVCGGRAQAKGVI